MKNLMLTGSILLLGFTSCKKFVIPVQGSIPKVETTQSSPVFVKYLIKKGNQYCENNAVTACQYAELKFAVRFDSTAIYQTVLVNNQLDINKLYGFSDNNALHHAFSARFGWRWSNNALRLFGYVYNDSIRSSAEIGAIKIGTEYNCSIKVNASTYTFTADGKSIVLPRTSTTLKASGYKLFPYFGGDENAPHDINIWIKEL